MKSREELLREAAEHPERLVEYISTLQEQLDQAQALIAELKRELFGAKADKLNAEQEQQLRQLLEDVQEQNQRPSPLSQELLEEALAQERAEQHQRAKERRRRHLSPVELEKQQVILEPPDKLCPVSGEPRARMGQEVTTEYDYLPAKLIIREIVRPKYGRCGKPRVVFNIFVASRRGGIMRGRKRSHVRGPLRGREAFKRAHRVSSETDAQVDGSLRALARLLPRQAAREAFNRATSREADRSTEEGRE